MKELPTAFKRCTNQRIISIFNEVLAHATDVGYHFCKPISTINLYEAPNSYWKNHTLGQCRRTSIGRRPVNVYVVINKTYAEKASDNDLRVLLIHEVAHATNEAFNASHGSIWQKVGDTIGAKYGIKVTQYTDYSALETVTKEDFKVQKREKKYAVQCPKCKRIVEFARMCNTLKNPSDYICVKCNEPLVRIK